MSLIYKIFAWIFWTINDCAYLMMSKQNFRNKIRILLTYLKLSLKLATINKIFKIRKESILGLKIDFFDYTIFYILFREIFLRQLYYFEPKKKNPLIIDGGANIGMATLFFKWMYPNSEIHAFEPDPSTFKLLTKNVEQNCLTNVHIHNAALVDKEGEIDFYIEGRKEGLLEMSVKPQRKYKYKIKTAGVMLSKFINKEFDFVKLDIEGSEPAVLGNLDKEGRLRKIKELVIEYHYKIKGDDLRMSKFLKLLEDNGFEYQMDAKCIPLYSKDQYQEILIYAYRV